MFAFAVPGRRANELEGWNKATLQALYISEVGVHLDVKWVDGKHYELEASTKQTIKRSLEWRAHDKSLDIEAMKSTSLEEMCQGKKLSCGQVYVKASWLKQLRNLIKHHTAAVKRSSK